MSGVLREQLVITSDTRHLTAVRDFVSRMIRASKLNRDDENKIILAVDEAVTNIIEHAYEDQAEGSIEIEIELDDHRFSIRILDTGKEFNPDEIHDPDIMDHVKYGKKKGLGIFLMRQIMDEVRYAFKDGIKNEVVLVKYIR